MRPVFRHRIDRSWPDTGRAFDPTICPASAKLRPTSIEFGPESTTSNKVGPDTTAPVYAQNIDQARPDFDQNMPGTLLGIEQTLPGVDQDEPGVYRSWLGVGRDLADIGPGATNFVLIPDNLGHLGGGPTTMQER